jgi:hypothetical protein
MAISPRDLGGISDAATQDNNVQVYWFVRLDIASPVGTKCFTNKPCDATGKITLNLRGDGSFDWYEYDVEVGTIKEQVDDDTNLSFLKFGNVSAQAGLLDRQWTKWSNTPGLRGTTVWIYKAQFDPHTDSYLGAYLRFYGELGGGTYNDVAAITVRTKDADSESPEAHIDSSCVFLRNYRGPDCGFAGSEPVGQLTCSGSRADCVLRSNQLNFGGFDRLPAEGSEQVWGSVGVVGR